MENNEDLDNINKIASLFKEYWKLYDQYPKTHDQSLTSRIDGVVDEMGKCICKLEYSFKDLDYFSKLDEESFSAEVDEKIGAEIGQKKIDELFKLGYKELDKRNRFKEGSIKFLYHHKRAKIIEDKIERIIEKKVERY